MRYSVLHDTLMYPILTFVRRFMDGVTLEDMASTGGLLESQKQLIEAVLQLDLSLDKQAFISNLIKVLQNTCMILPYNFRRRLLRILTSWSARFAPLLPTLLTL